MLLELSLEPRFGYVTAAFITFLCFISGLVLLFCLQIWLSNDSRKDSKGNKEARVSYSLYISLISLFKFNRNQMESQREMRQERKILSVTWID